VLSYNLTYTRKWGVKLDNKYWYDLPKSIKTIHEDKGTVLWNKQVGTNITIPNIKLDIIIHDNKQGT